MSKANFYVHPSSIVDTSSVGDDTTIWAFVHILKDVVIGSNCNICDHCFVESGVVVGNNVTIKSGVYIWTGTNIEDNAFLGPNVVFTNDLRPRSKNKDYKIMSTRIHKGASIGANSTILAGVSIGKYALTGIGSVITKDVKDYALVYGNPARQHGWVDESGEKLLMNGSGIWYSLEHHRSYREVPSGLELILLNDEQSEK